MKIQHFLKSVDQMTQQDEITLYLDGARELAGEIRELMEAKDE